MQIESINTLLELIKECLVHFDPEDPSNVIILSYPRVYGSTSGPFGGIGGAAMTAFQTVILHDIIGQKATVYLAGPKKFKVYDLKDEKIRDIFWKKFAEQKL